MDSILVSETDSQSPNQLHGLKAKGTVVKPAASGLNILLSDFQKALSIAGLLSETTIKAPGISVMLFGVFGIISDKFISGSSLGWQQLMSAFMHMAFYIWLLIFYFDLSNQKDPESIEEDRINKPWRAIPSGKLTIEEAERWYVRSILMLSLSSSLWLGGFSEAVVFMVTTWLYDHGAADPWWGKNICNAILIMSANLGAARVGAQAMGLSLTRPAFEWCSLVGLVVLTTIQMQDLKDQPGDKARGRNTVPLLIGDGATRVLTALLVWTWSIVCPLYWESGFTAASVLALLAGTFVNFRMLWYRSRKSDRLTYHCCGLLWLPLLYSAPLLSRW